MAEGKRSTSTVPPTQAHADWGKYWYECSFYSENCWAEIPIVVACCLPFLICECVWVLFHHHNSRSSWKKGFSSFLLNSSFYFFVNMFCYQIENTFTQLEMLNNCKEYFPISFFSHHFLCHFLLQDPFISIHVFNFFFSIFRELHKSLFRKFHVWRKHEHAIVSSFRSNSGHSCEYHMAPFMGNMYPEGI